MLDVEKRTNIETMWDDVPLPTAFSLESVEFGECKHFKELYDAYRDIQNGSGDNFRGWMMPKEGISF